MYILDFFRNLIRRSNTYVIIYLILNLLFITLVTHILFGQQDLLLSFFVAMFLYTISLAVALSPVGEWILRKQIGAHEIKRMDYKEYFDPIFQDVYAKAKLADPSLPNDIKLFMSNDKSPNAFATGRKTVCLTEGIVDKPVDELKAVLAHEFGHLSHRDTDVLLVVIVGNFIFSALITFLKVIITIIGFFLSLSERRFRYVITSTLTVVTINFLMWAWTKIGTILIMKSSRENEFEADRFASNLGYGNALCTLLDSFGTSDEKGLFALLASSHPDTNERIFRLQELGATYRSNRFSNIPNQNVQMQQGIPTNSQQTFQQQNNFGNQQQFQNGQAYQQQAAPINQGQFQHNGQVQQHNFPNQGQFQHNGQAYQQQATPINQGQFLHNGQVQQHNFPNNGQFQHNGQVQQHNFPNQGQFQHNGQVQQHNFPNNGQFQHNGQVQQHNFLNNGQFQHNGQVQQQATPVNQGQFQYNGEVQQHNFPNNGQFQHNGQVQQQAAPIDEGLHLQHNEQVNINNVNNQQIDTNTAENTEKTTPINPFGDVIIYKIATQKNKNLLKNTDNKSVTQETAPVKEAAVSQEAKPETPKVEKTENVNPFGDPVFKK